MDYTTKYKFGSDISPFFIKNILPRTKNKKVLDIGCGQGDCLQYFGKQSLGLDLSPNNIKNAKSKNLRAQIYDINNPKFIKEKFDAVYLSHILEHVENPLQLIKKSYEYLKKNGIIIISIPNESSFIHLKYPYFTGDGNHLYSFSVNNMKELLITAGFQNTQLYFDYWTALTKKLKINPYLYHLNHLPNFIKIKLSWAYWFIANKK